MISDIFIPTYTVLVKYYENEPFHDFVVKEFPACSHDHLPEDLTLKSIEYKHDEVIEAFLGHLFNDSYGALDDLIDRGAEVEVGYYHIQLESEEDYTKRTMYGLEFIFQKLHESYSFIASFHLYLDESGIRFFNKLYTFESDEEAEEDRPKNLHEYTHFLDSYFYEDCIPDCYADEVAKWLLLRGGV
jgi:hypothetical protein